MIFYGKTPPSIYLPIIFSRNYTIPFATFSSTFLRQKVGMLLDTLKEEESGVHVGDDLLKTMEEIAFRGASERRERTPEKYAKLLTVIRT